MVSNSYKATLGGRFDTRDEFLGMFVEFGYFVAVLAHVNDPLSNILKPTVNLSPRVGVRA